MSTTPSGDLSHPVADPPVLGAKTAGPGFIRRNRFVLLLTITLIGFIAASVYFIFFYVPEGPLAAHGPTGRMSLGNSETVTWGIVLQANTSNDDIVIDSIAPVSVTGGVEIIGLTITSDRRGPTSYIGTAAGYPPEGFRVAHPRGAVIPPVTEEDPGARATVLFGVRRITGVDEGLIEGIHINYHIGNRRYETVINGSLRVFSPEVWEQERSPSGRR